VHQILDSVARNPVFTTTVAPYLLLGDDLMIRGVNNAYLSATGFGRASDLVGREIFDAFPDNPSDREATGVRNLSSSLHHVLSSGESHEMAVQRYDVAPAGQFTPKLWSPVNSPILDDSGHTVGVLHHVEDISDLLFAPAGELGAMASADARTGALHQRAGRKMLTETSRLRDALVAVVASRPTGSDPLGAVASRRHELWIQVVSCAADSRWNGWTDALCSVATSVLPTVDGVAVSLRDHGHQELVAASDERAWRAEQLDYLVGEGPALDTAASGLPVHTADLAAEVQRWPGYVAAAADVAVAGVSTFPIVMGDSVIATISFFRYHGRPHSSWAEWIDTVTLADLACTTIVADHARIDGQLASGGSVGYHDVAVAAGLVAAQLDITTDAATARIRAHALTHRISVSETAAMIIDRRIRFEH
jgi:hypothetical protein